MTDAHAPAAVVMSVPDALREVRIARERRDEAEALYDAAHAHFVRTLREARYAGAPASRIAASASLSAQRVRQHVHGVRPA